MTTTTTRVTTGKTRPRGRKNTLLWAAQIALAALFLVTAAPKLAAAQSAVATFARIGAGQWLRYLVGAAEPVGAVGLLIPGLAGLAAAGLAADMAGATIINTTVLHSAAALLTIPLCVALVFLAWNRREQISHLAAALRP
jgi:putative oxidoreductase